MVVALEDERVPRAARQFAVAAQRAGWSVEITYARGPQRGAREGTFKISDSILVACSRHPPWTGGGREHVRAQWLGGKADECGHTVDGQGVLMTISQGKRLLTQEA